MGEGGGGARGVGVVDLTEARVDANREAASRYDTIRHI